jgi:hypothetical protein
MQENELIILAHSFLALRINIESHSQHSASNWLIPSIYY